APARAAGVARAARARDRHDDDGADRVAARDRQGAAGLQARAVRRAVDVRVRALEAERARSDRGLPGDRVHGDLDRERGRGPPRRNHQNGAWMRAMAALLALTAAGVGVATFVLRRFDPV